MNRNRWVVVAVWVLYALAVLFSARAVAAWSTSIVGIVVLLIAITASVKGWRAQE